MSKAITEKHPDEGPGPRPGWTPAVELAPSVMREDEPTFARIVGLAGSVLVIFAGVALIIANYKGAPGKFGVGWMTVILLAGLLGMMYHAVFDGDLQVRRLYWGIGIVGIIGGAIVCLIPVNQVQGALFIVGFPAMALGLIFVLAFLKHEDDPRLREWTLKGIAFMGAAMAVVGLLGGNVANSIGAPRGVTFLLPYGALVALLGLAYLTSFVISEGTKSDLGYWVGRGLSFVGLIVIIIAAIRASMMLWFKLGWKKELPESYLVPGGLVIMLVGLAYTLVSLLLTSESKVVLLAKRELASFFYSPVAHLVLLGQALMAWVIFSWMFIGLLVDPRSSLPEPVVQWYFLDYPPIICVLFIVPVMTMRLFAEEQRSGTMEVLLTAPVDELTIVMAKFWAALGMFMFVWLPWALLLVGLRIIGGKPFDYHSLFVFLLTLTVTGAGFVSMGMFFSSLTRNQIVSAVLTFAGMLALTMVFFVARRLQTATPPNIWADRLMHISFVQMWIDSFRGFWIPRRVVFWITFAIFWLFVTVKVLESRKWR